jgi:2-C-methyl-D-erythritol 4-phosphate cytidylyltransferase
MDNSKQRNSDSIVKDNPVIAAVILAAGSSSRMDGIKKEYQKIDDSDLTVLGSAVSAFVAVPSVDIIVIAIAKNEEAEANNALPPLAAIKSGIHLVTGGDCRRASVFNALTFLAAFNPDYVLIHDGARPWISVSLINHLIAQVKEHNAIIPLVPLTETPKEYGEWPANQAALIKTHLKRSHIGCAQTPQAFRFKQILYAHEQAAKVPHINFTDDAEIWDKFCGPVAAIAGSPENRKITFPEDLKPCS